MLTSAFNINYVHLDIHVILYSWLLYIFVVIEV